MSTRQDVKNVEQQLPNRASHHQRFAEVEHAQNIRTTLMRMIHYFDFGGYFGNSMWHLRPKLTK